jgi:hypothetical protein
MDATNVAAIRARVFMFELHELGTSRSPEPTLPMIFPLHDDPGAPSLPQDFELVVLDRNLFEIPAREIKEASVTMTLFDGRAVYRR